jgi:alpha-1,2-mannosyltransferase
MRARVELRSAWSRLVQSPVTLARLVAGVSLIVWLIAFRPWDWYMGDLVVYRGASLAHLHGHNLYTVLNGRDHLVFTYPPFAAIAILPLALVGLETAKVALSTITLASVVLSLVVASRQVRAEGRAVGAAFVPLAFAIAIWLEPVRSTVSFGQIDGVLMALVIVDVLLLSNRRAGGVLSGVAAAIKLTPLAIIPYFLATQRYRAAAIASATFVGCVGVGFAAAPGASRTYWGRHYYSAASRIGLVENASNQSVRGILARLLHTEQVPTWWILVALALFVAGLLAARILYRAGLRLWSLVAIAIATLCASPISWSHHWIWCAVMMVVCWDIACHVTSRRYAVISVLTMVPFATALIFWAPHAGRQELHDSWWQELLSSTYVLAGITLVGLMLAGAAAGRSAADRVCGAAVLGDAVNAPNR